MQCRSEEKRSGAAGAFGSAASTSGTEIDAAVKLETVHLKIDVDGLRFFKEFRVDDKGVPIDLEFAIRFNWLIQSHGQAGAPSAAFVEENPDRFDVFAFEILGDLFDGRLRHC
jgi:hypothetical protein